jgi:RNA polymerase sigma factor (sigma-70 family)
MNRVLRHLCRAALLSADEGLTDAQLLEAFLARREGAAFEALLRRHGPMVLGVCRRVLRNVHDAEDAFQATFLVLARKAGSVRSREVLASWLYGVAYRTSMKARAMNAKRRTKEREASAAARPAAPADGRLEELLERLDEELHRLPERYRVPVVLCELEGRSRREAALQLGLAEGTLSWRLAQARKLLARKLSRYGAVLSAGAVTAALSQGAASARLSPSLLASTARHVVTAGPVPAKVMALTEGVMKAMFLSKLKVVGWAVVLAASVGAGVAGLAYRASAQQVSPPDELVAQKAPLDAQPKVRPAADDLESLRLEIEALRKELRATRERVKALEGRLQGPSTIYKFAPAAAEGKNYSKPVPKVPDGKTYSKPVPKGSDDDLRSEKPKGPNKAKWASPVKGPKTATDPSSKAGGWRFGGQSLTPKADADPMAEFEEAVRRLRKDPKDKEATAALEMALRRLRQGDFKRKPSSK